MRKYFSMFFMMISLAFFASFNEALGEVKGTAGGYIKLTPNQIVETPSAYLGKNVEITGRFDKFTTLGLDYKRAMKPSTQYIAFLMQRDDVKDHNVPLSELKLFVKRDYAEKFIELNTNDVIKVKGKIFSDALGDGWAEIDTIEIVSKAPEPKTK